MSKTHREDVESEGLSPNLANEGKTREQPKHWTPLISTLFGLIEIQIRFSAKQFKY